MTKSIDIILAENDIDTSIRIKRAFSHYSRVFNFTSVLSGGECLYIMNNCNYDMIIANFNLPDMTAIELCRKIDNSNVIFVYAEKEYSFFEKECLNAGAELFFMLRTEADIHKMPAVIYRHCNSENDIRKTKNVHRDTKSASFELDMRKHDYYLQLESLFEERTKNLKESKDELVSINEELKESQKRFETIFNSITDPMNIIDSDFKIIHANTARLSLLNTNFENVRGRYCYELFRHESYICENCPANKTFETGKPSSSKLEIPVSNGKRLYFEIHAHPMFSVNGEVEFVIEYARDITTTKLLEEQVQRMNKLSSLGQLAAGIAHEIQNPLSGMKVSAQLLERRCKNDEKNYKDIVNILHGIEKARNVIRNLLNFAKPTKPRIQNSDLNQICNHFLDFIKPSADAKKVKLNTNIDNHEYIVKVDPEQIHQTLLNLAMNAFDAMKDDGVLSIKTQTTVISNQTYFQVLFRDNGCGIEKENIEKIFDPFYTNKPNGVGLGLSVTAQILKENDAFIQVESQTDVGTVFTISFPDSF